ncbi:MAG TPA: MtrB/PioB family outer membrane beta-barrel protein, partial [Rhodocyclaceae bacterium]
MTQNQIRFRPRADSVATVAALAALAALSSPAAGEPMLHAPSLYRASDMSRFVDNYVELGIGYNSKDSYKFGEWNGLREKGAYPIFGFNWLSRARDNGANYWELRGSGLGLETRKFGLEGGSQGRWRLNASADRLVRSELDSARFVHTVGLGTNNLSGISPPTTVPYKIEQGRDFYRLGFSATLSDNWNASVNYREDRRDGTRVMGAPFEGGLGRPLNVPYQIDDHTQQVDAQLSYADELSQLQFAYHFSRYENDAGALELENDSATVVGRVSLMPSNDYHQLSLTGAYRVTASTRVAAKLSYG